MKKIRWLEIQLIIWVFLLISKEIFAQAGKIDPTFGQGGIVSTPFNTTGNSSSSSIAIQSDGKIVAGASSQYGGHTQFSLFRCNRDGSIDKNFGTNGVVITQVGTAGNDVSSVAIQKDGKIIAAGDSYDGTKYVFTLVRYDAGGSIDSTFGVNGIVTTSIGSTGDFIKSISIQNDGKIIAAGVSDTPGNSNLAVARYDSNGSIDSTFGLNGITTFGATGIILSAPQDMFSYGANFVAVQSSGKIVVGGYSYFIDTKTFTPNGHFLLIRYNSNGSLDYSFNSGVVLTLTGSPYDASGDGVNSILFQKDGKIIEAGYSLQSGYYDYAMARLDTNGVLDGSFGTDGIVRTYLNGITGATSAAIQDDGKIVLAGYGGSGLQPHYFVLIRYNGDGSLDNSFGSGGIASAGGLPDGEAHSVAIQSDGKIVATGFDYDGTYYNLAIVRFGNDGAIDNSFGQNGFTISSAGNSNDVINSLALQNDGKIVAAGYSYFGTISNFTLLRYNANGTPDRFFGTNGIEMTDFGNTNSQVNSVAIDSDGTIAAAGFYFNGKNNDFAVVRYTPAGIPDNNFGKNGTAGTPIGSFDDEATGVAIQKDHKIIAAGYYLNGNYNNIALVRYNTNGSLDNSFGLNGIVTTQVGTSHNFAQSVAVQNDGKIVVAGSAIIGGSYNIALVRYNNDGSLDINFGNNGIITTLIGKGSFAYSVLIQGDGKIVAAGYALIGSKYEFALARYNSNGIQDSTFGINGISTTQIGSTSDFAYSAALQSDGKIVAAGYAEGINKFEFALARYNTDGTLDQSFGENGAVLTQTSISNDYARSVAVQNDGKIIAAGYASGPGINNYRIFTLIRYNGNITAGVKLINDPAASPASFSLEQNYPNPFNPSTTIKYTLPERSFVTLKVYDLLGKEVAQPVNCTLGQGTYETKFNAERLSNGVYIYSIRLTGLNSRIEYRFSRKMILLK